MKPSIKKLATAKPNMSKIKFASIIVTYRCNAHCQMCNTWKYPSRIQDELPIEIYHKLPKIPTINITGGEPFLREDLAEIITILKTKAKRIVISSNGYYTDKIVKLFRIHNNLGIRISLEGMQATNDQLRGLTNGFAQGIRTITELRSLGIKDIGVGITINDNNIKDLLALYNLAKKMKLEFATAATHNSFYFHKYDNVFITPQQITLEITKLIKELLRSRNMKDWFRAYFNYGLINYINNKPRLLPCKMGHDAFFLDPHGEIFPCNVMEQSMGNLQISSFAAIWNSATAASIRNQVKHCKKNCWMIGSVAPQMQQRFWQPLLWILKQKFTL